MTQLKLFKYSTGLLFFLNIGLVAFFVITKPDGLNKKAGIKFQDRAAELLKLDEKQKASFIGLAKAHNEKISEQAKLQRELLQKYFLGLMNNTEPIENPEIQKSIQQQNLDQIETTHAHFKEVKAMIGDDRNDEFEVFVNEAVGKIMQ